MDISQNLKTVLDNINNDINVINDKVESKQAEITSENKLDYSLISGAPAGGEAVWGSISGTLSAQTDLQTALNAKANANAIPLSTSQLTNDSNFVTSSVMEDALSGKQNEITYEDPLDAHSVTTELDPWQGDPEFRVDDAINEVHREARIALSGVDAVSGALSGKQDLIDDMNWLPATYVHMDINHYPSDPDFTVEAAVNMTRDDVYSVSGVVSGLLSSKQDVIDSSNMLNSRYVSVNGDSLEFTISNILSSKQDVIDSNHMLDGYYVRVDNDNLESTIYGINSELSSKQHVIDSYNTLNGEYVEVYFDNQSTNVKAAVYALEGMASYAANGVDVISGALSGKQDLITIDNKLDYALVSGTPTIPVSTSQLTNDSDFQTSTDVANAISGKLDAPSGGTEGQVLTKTSNGEEWADAQGGTIKVDDKTASGVFVVDFAGAQIQKYDVESAVSGSLTIQYDNTDIPNGTAPTIELQIPVTGDVSLVNLPAKTKIIDMPEVLSGGEYMYHDIVFRAQRDMNGKVKIYANYSYNFEEEKANDNYFYFEATQAGVGPTLSWCDDDNDPDEILNLEYSTDKVNWTPIPSSIWIEEKAWAYDGEPLNVGDRLYLRGDNHTINTSAMFDGQGQATSHCYNFVGGPGLSLGGNIMSLLDSEMELDEVPEYCFCELFAYGGFESTSALILPAMTLNDHCYYGMFKDNGDMVDTPQTLPATTLAPYCYAAMFDNCYGFEVAPEIMATTFSAGGHDMEGMFAEDDAITTLKVHFTDWSASTNATSDWLYHPSTGATFYCPSGLDTTTRSYSTIPADWIVVNY